MSLQVTQNHLQNYSSWLSLQKYQTNTIRNYLLDLNIFLKLSLSTLSPETITNFITTDSTQNNHSRHLASISKFCQFAQDQQLITDNPFALAKKRALNPATTRDINLLLSQFAHSLAREGKSPITIKSYLGDIHQYIHFCESQIL